MDIGAREMNSAKRNADDVQVKRFCSVFPVKFRSGSIKYLEEERVAVSAMDDYSSCIPDLEDDVPVFEYEIIKEDTRWNLRDLVSKKDRGPTNLRRIQALRRDHGLFVPSDVQAIQVLIKDALAALGSHCDGNGSLVKQTKIYDAKKTQ